MSKSDSTPATGNPPVDTDVRMRSITAAELIGDFLRDGLPLVSWTIESEHAPFSAQFPLLVGVCHHAPCRVDVVRAYGERLGVELRDPHRDGRYVEATAEVRGVWVRVWALRDGAR